MVAIMTGIGILWIPVVQNVQGGQLFIYIQAVSAYFSPPIAALYLISILWTKATEKVCHKTCFMRNKQSLNANTTILSNIESYHLQRIVCCILVKGDVTRVDF